MPQRRTWELSADEIIKDFRHEGRTWADIGRELGLSRNTVIERGRRIRAVLVVHAPEKVAKEKANRPPYPAGHPVTWGLLCDLPYPK